MVSTMYYYLQCIIIYKLCVKCILKQVLCTCIYVMIYIFYLSFIGCRMCENLMLVNKSNSKCCTSYHFENFSACMVLNCNGFFYCKIHALVIYKGLLNFRYSWAKNSYKDLTGPFFFFFFFFHFAYRYLSVSHSHCYLSNNLLSLWKEHIDGYMY